MLGLYSGYKKSTQPSTMQRRSLLASQSGSSAFPLGPSGYLDAPVPS